MTEQERIDREALLRRSAAVAGAVYLAPVLTSAAAAGIEGCRNFTCSKKKKRWRKRDSKKCEASGAGCCCPAPGTPCGYCDSACIFQSDGCPPSDQQPCRPLQPCGQSGACACFLPVWNRNANQCMAFRSNTCADYPPCSKQDGSGCPPGLCCYDSCCPEGICEVLCSNASAPRIGRSAGSGPTLTT